MNELFACLVAAFFVISIIKGIYDSIYYSTYHWGWSEDARPDMNAVIVSAEPEFKRMKAHSKFVTTIKFSDGFWFTSPATKKSYRFAGYKFSVDLEQLKIDMEKAETIHSEETEARLKKDISTRKKEAEARLKKEGH